MSIMLYNCRALRIYSTQPATCDIIIVIITLVRVWSAQYAMCPLTNSYTPFLDNGNVELINAHNLTIECNKVNFADIF